MNLCQDAFVLHRRAYRDSSLLVDFFTRDKGIIRCVARGGRSTKQSSLLAPFQLLWLSYRSGRNLASLDKIEIQTLLPQLSGKTLYCGFYLNELLTRLLIKEDPYPELFDAYQQSLIALSQSQPIEVTLRRFELCLLQCLGYGLSFEKEALTGAPLLDGVYYRFIARTGFVLLDEPQKNRHNQRELFLLDELRGIANNNFENRQVAWAAKRLSRLAIDDLLEGKPLMSRELFKKDKKT